MGKELNFTAGADSLRKLFPKITAQQIQQLQTFGELLRDWNRRINLISPRDVDRLLEKHIIPSVLPLLWIDFPREAWILDIGSGGGFPAVPIKIIRPDLQMMLVESTRKKALFLRHAAERLPLRNLQVVNDRVENIARREEYRERFNLATARAVTDIATLIKWANPFLKRGGKMVLWKGEADEAELIAVCSREKREYRIVTPSKEIARQFPHTKTLRWFVLGSGK